MSKLGVIASTSAGEIIICPMKDLKAEVARLAKNPDCLYSAFRNYTSEQAKVFIEALRHKYPHYKVIDKANALN